MIVSNSSARSFLVRLAIVVALSSAGWRFLIHPLRARVGERNANLASMRAEIQAGEERIAAEDATPEEVITELRRRAAALRELWGVSADASRLYERFDALAHRYGVTIERMEPRVSATKAAPPGADEDLPHVTDIGYSIELVASYDAVARFLHAVQGETGMVRIESFRIAPAESTTREPVVRASVRTTHFQVTGGLAAFSAGAGVAP